MKNLKKALAVVVALSVMSVSAVAFADVEKQSFAFDDANVTGDYNESANSATATVTGALDESQMTFLVLDKDVELDPEEESYDVEAADILYIDQKEFDASATNTFTGVINPARITGSGGVMVKGSYPIRVGYFDSLGEFQIASGTLVLRDKVVDEITGIAFTNGTGSINATIGTGVDLGAQVTGTGNFEDGYSIAIKDGTNSISATLDSSNYHLDAGQIGSVTVVATATGDANVTAELVVNFGAPTNGLTSVSASADYVEVTTGTTVNLSSTVADPTSGATVSWAKTSGDLAATATLVDNGNGTATITSSTAGSVTLTVTATTSYRTETDTIEITFKAPVDPYKHVTIIWGDVNADGSVASTDINALIMRAIGGQVTFTENVSKESFTIGTSYDGVVWGDVNADGSVASTDINALIMRAIGGQITFTDKVTSKSYTIGNSYELNLPK